MNDRKFILTSNCFKHIILFPISLSRIKISFIAQNVNDIWVNNEMIGMHISVIVENSILVRSIRSENLNLWMISRYLNSFNQQ